MATLDWERELYTEVVDEAVIRLGIKDRMSFSDIQFIGHLIADAAGVHHDYQPPVSDPSREEIARLQRELAKERAKVGCRLCNGTGRLHGMAGPWHTNTHCWKCNGEGKHGQ